MAAVALEQLKVAQMGRLKDRRLGPAATQGPDGLVGEVS